MHFPLFSFQFFSSFLYFFFVISFENVRLVIQQIPSLSFLQCLLFPFLLLLLLNTYIHTSHLSCSMSFHSPLGTFPLAPCLIICVFSMPFFMLHLFDLCHLVAFSLLVVSLVCVCFLLHVIPVFWCFFSPFLSLFFFSIRCSVIYVQQFQALKVILAVVDLLA